MLSVPSQYWLIALICASEVFSVLAGRTLWGASTTTCSSSHAFGTRLRAAAGAAGHPLDFKFSASTASGTSRSARRYRCVRALALNLCRKECSPSLSLVARDNGGQRRYPRIQFENTGRARVTQSTSREDLVSGHCLLPARRHCAWSDLGPRARGCRARKKNCGDGARISSRITRIWLRCEGCAPSPDEREDRKMNSTSPEPNP